MGRKIPAKKHRGVKDPLQQQAKRDQKLKSKINAPPSDPDAQPVPRSLTELFSRPVRTPTKKLKRKLALVPAAATMGKSNPISRLRKLPGESGRGFTMRINSAIRALHDSDEAQEYPQDLEEEDARGSRIAALRERRQRRRGRPPPPARDSRKDRVKLKKAAAAQAALAAQRERPQYERVPFGAVSAAPPALPAPRGAPHSAPRPGRRELLLNELLRPGTGSGAAAGVRGTRDAIADERERARRDAVAAYRDLKKQKRKQAPCI